MKIIGKGGKRVDYRLGAERSFFLMIMIGLVLIAGGCSSVSKAIQTKSVATKADAFREADVKSEIQAGYADIVIVASIKTHLEGRYLWESSASNHGKASYRFLLNIDGQAAEWSVDGIKEDKPAYGRDGQSSGDPEAGPGMRYVLTKRLRLAAGMHRVFFALPQENYAMEIPVVLEGNREHQLEFVPEYRQMRRNRETTYIAGLSAFRAFLDNIPVGQE